MRARVMRHADDDDEHAMRDMRHGGNADDMMRDARNTRYACVRCLRSWLRHVTARRCR